MNRAPISNKRAWRIVFAVYIAAVAFGCTVLVQNAGRPW